MKIDLYLKLGNERILLISSLIKIHLTLKRENIKTVKGSQQKRKRGGWRWIGE